MSQPKPCDLSLTAILRARLADEAAPPDMIKGTTFADRIVATLIHEARSGDVDAIALMFDRIDGLPARRDSSTCEVDDVATAAELTPYRGRWPDGGAHVDPHD